MATGAAGTRHTDGGVCTRVLRAGPVSANLSPLQGGRQSPGSNLSGQKPSPPTPRIWTCPGAGRQAGQGPSAQPRGFENLSSQRGEVPAARGDRTGRTGGQEQGPVGPGGPWSSQAGREHAWNGHGSHRKGQAEKGGHSTRS